MHAPATIGSKIRIVRVIGRLNVGGPAIHVVNLAAGLDRTRYEQLLVIGTESPTEGSMTDFAVACGVRPYVIPEIVTAFNLAPRDATALAKLYALMRRERPHIVHTHTAKAGFLGRTAARLAGVPIVVHTYHGHVLHGYWGPAKTWVVRQTEKALGRLTNRLVAVSERVKAELIAHGVARAEKIEVIPLGFDLEPFDKSNAVRGQFRQELGFNGDHKLVGIVGRLFPIKNHRLFLHAAAQVAAREPEARFAIVGDGVLRARLCEQARELGIAERVVFTGWRRDLPKIYADLDVLVVSSDNEGTPVSAIEAMASGCPVVATRVGGLPDLITDQQTGILVPPRDARTLANAILELLQSPGTAKQLAQAAVEKVQQRFTLQRLIDDIDQLYWSLVQAKLGQVYSAAAPPSSKP